MNKAIIILLMAAGLLNMAGGYQICAAAEVDIIQETAFLLQQFGSHFKINRKTSENVGNIHTEERKSLAKLEEDAQEFPPNISPKKPAKKTVAPFDGAVKSLLPLLKTGDLSGLRILRINQINVSGAIMMKFSQGIKILFKSVTIG